MYDVCFAHFQSRGNDFMIKGIQKVTLLDYPGKVACTLFTGGCNFRCPFCQNSDLVLTPASVPDIPDDEIFDYLRMRKGLLDAVCITGGEPLLHNELGGFIKKCRDIGYLVKLDTNGYEPEKLQKLIDAGIINYIAMDIKTSIERYPVVCGFPDMDVSRILKSVGIIRNSGIEHEFRTTVVHELHSNEDFEKIGQWLKGTKKYFLQLFTDSGAIIQPGLSAPSEDDMHLYLKTVKKYIPNAELRGVE